MDISKTYCELFLYFRKMKTRELLDYINSGAGDAESIRLAKSEYDFRLSFSMLYMEDSASYKVTELKPRYFRTEFSDDSDLDDEFFFW